MQKIISLKLHRQLIHLKNETHVDKLLLANNAIKSLK